MQFEYRITLIDYQEACQAHSKTQPFPYFVNLAFSIFFIVLGISDIVMGFQGGISGYFITGLLWLFLGVFVNPYFGLYRRYGVDRNWKNMSNIKEEQNLNVTPEGVKVKGETFESKIQWTGLIKFWETNKLFLLYNSKNTFFILPKRAFASDEQIEEFRELLRSNIRKSR